MQTYNFSTLFVFYIISLYSSLKHNLKSCPQLLTFIKCKITRNTDTFHLFAIVIDQSQTWYSILSIYVTRLKEIIYKEERRRILQFSCIRANVSQSINLSFAFRCRYKSNRNYARPRNIILSFRRLCG